MVSQIFGNTNSVKDDDNYCRNQQELEATKQAESDLSAEKNAMISTREGSMQALLDPTAREIVESAKRDESVKFRMYEPPIINDVRQDGMSIYTQETMAGQNKLKILTLNLYLRPLGV